MLLAALAPLIAAAAAFAAYALWDLRRSTVKVLPKWAWAVIILISIPAGAVVYFLAGREAT
ncbi:MAG: PLDc N-terminal domain-containing protein [Actinomycetota bacterium]